MHTIEENLIAFKAGGFLKGSPERLIWASDIHDDQVFDYHVSFNLRKPVEAHLGEFEFDKPDKFNTFGKQRQSEYFTSRWLIQYVQSQMGVDATFSPEEFYKLGKGEISGSISHSKGLVRVCLSHAEMSPFVGVDSERVDRKSLGGKLWNKIANSREQKMYVDGNFDILANRVLLFSAKEALYKFAYPFYLKYFGFLDAELVEVNFEENYLILTSPVLNNINRDSVKVEFKFQDDYVHTVIRT